MSVLLFLIVILIFIVLIGILNEKFFHIQADIALIMFSLVISLMLLICHKCFDISTVSRFVEGVGEFGFEEYLMQTEAVVKLCT